MYQSKTNFLELAQKYGSPLYVYELDQVQKRYEELKTGINYSQLKVHYAMKANYNVPLLKFINSLGVGIDAVSPGEIYLALKAGVAKENIIFTANNLTNEEIKEAQGLGVLFNLGSLSEIKRYGELFPNQNICIRVNPDVIAGSHAKIQTGGPLSKFGILLEHLGQALEICQQFNLTVIGIHKHTGSGIKDQEKYLQAVDNLLQIVTPENFPSLEFVDLGGGLFVPYHPDEKEIDYSKFAPRVLAKVLETNKLFGKELKLYFEPGKFLIAEAGHLIIQVNTIKDNNGHLIAGTNSGFNHLARPVMYDAYHHIENLSNPNGVTKTYDIVGNICETGDNFASSRPIAEIREGDFLVIHNGGAYCYSMGSVYNLRTLPAEVCTINGEVTYHRPRETNQDFVNKLYATY